ERLALAVDGLSELFALFDADDRIVLTNAAWRELNRKVIDTAGPGTSFEDHLRAAIQAGLLPEAVGREEEWLRRRMDRHRNPKGPFEVERQDGRWLLVNEQRLPDGGTVLILTDITERKRAEEALREAERRFRNLVEGSVQGILIHQDRRPVYVNQAWAEIHGYTVDEVLAMESVIPLIAPDDRPRMDEFRKLRMEGGEAPSHYEYEAIKKDGSRICLENMATVVEWKDEPAIQSTIVDITERKRAEEALRESEARFRAVLDNSPAKIHIKDLDGRYTLINRRSELLFGVTDEEARGKTSRDIFPKKVADAFAGHDQKVIESGQSIEEEEKWVSDDGLRTYLTVKFPIRDADGEIVAVGAIGTDITEHKRAELVIRESWELLRGAVNSLQEGFALFDADDRLILINGEYERVNPSAPEMLEQGLRYEDVLRANVERGMIAEAIGREEEFIRERLERHRDPRGTILRHFTDGKWCLIREARTPDGGTAVTFTDVTELKRTEEALLQAKQQNDMILEAAGEGIYGLDLQGRTTFINPAAAKMVGWELEDLIGLPQHDIVHHTKPDGSSYPREECPIYAAFKDGKRHHVTDEVFWKKDGTSFPVEYVSTPIRVEGELIGAVVVFRDITERMQAEEKLRESEEQLRLSLAAARVGTFCWNIQEDTNFWDDRMHEIWGLEPGTYTSTATKDFFANVHPEDAEWVNQTVDRTINDDAEHNIEYRIVRPDQSIAYVHELAAVVRDDRKRPLRLIGVCLDVTGRKRAEEEKAALEREVQQAGRTEAIGLLAGGIAHEINTPIQYIRDNLRFLDDAWGDIGTVVKKYRMLAQAARDKGVLESEVRKADSAADEADLEYLLDEFSKATRQSIEGTGRVADIVLAMKEFSHPSMKEKVATDINRAIKSTLTVSRNEWKHVAEVDFDLDETLAPVICLAGEVNQVFLNLIINAVHAIAAKGGDGKERITISTRKDGDWVEIRVADTGTGIPEDMRDKIFNPFFTTKEVGKGTGQGLAICQDIVTNKHGGKIFFETEMGKGTTFVVRLPLDAQEKASEAA
ncbi:MAG: PAS domain S-box protein, partial [Rhodospirillales bacterium]